jgi:hypothetical protein
MKPILKPPGTKRLKLEYEILHSTSAFKCKMRRYILGGGGGSASGSLYSTVEIDSSIRAGAVAAGHYTNTLHKIFFSWYPPPFNPEMT